MASSMTKFTGQHLQRFLAGLALRRPLAVVVLAALGAALSLFLTVRYLEFHTNRADLVSSGDRYTQLDARDKEEFDELPERVVVVIRSENPETAKAFATALGQRWENDPKIDKVLYRINLDSLKEKGLLYLSPEDLMALRQKLETNQHLLRELAASPTLQTVFALIDRELTSALVSHVFTAGLAEGEEEEAPIDFTPVISLLRSMNQWLGGARALGVPWDSLVTANTESASHDGFLWSDDKRLLFVLANPRKDIGELNRFHQAVQSIREDVRDLQRAYPNTEVGITGRAVLEADEMAVAKRDMSIATLISLVGVILLFIVFFRGVVRPALAAITLVIALCWSLGFITLTVGHLNILTIVLLPMVIGLGIDYSIHFLARYEEEWAAAQTAGLALRRTFVGTGRAILAAALTTALAFFTLVLTGFKGLMELGFLSASGILLAALATLTVLPALLALAGQSRSVEFVLAQRGRDGNPGGYLRAIGRHPWATLATSGLLVGLSVLALDGVRADFNLLSMQTQGTESVVWAQKIFESAKRSVLFEELRAGSLDEVKRKTAALKALPSVDGVESIAAVIPEDQPRKLELIKAIRPLLADVSPNGRAAESPDVDAVRAVLGRIKFKMGGDIETAATGDEEQFSAERREVRRLIHEFIEVTGRMMPADVRQALSAFQAELRGDLHAKLALLGKNLTAGPLTVEDLPPELRARYIGNTGQYRLFVYPAENIWEFEPLGRFVKDVQSVDPEAHGTPVTTFEFLRQIKEGYERAALYAVVGVLFLAFLTLRGVRLTLLALVPLAVGTVWTLGLMGFLDVPLNVANLLFLPLIVGVGIDNGIYMVDRFREAERTGGTPSASLRSTGKAITLSSLTTIVGFGSLMISSHRGIQSLGLVVALGVGSVLVASLTTLPSLLLLLSRRTALRRQVTPRVTIDELRVLAEVPGDSLRPGMAAERNGSGRGLPATVGAGHRREAA
jgi:hopanoid biosynthesis associated RND transporter like protein HpnN